MEGGGEQREVQRLNTSAAQDRLRVAQQRRRGPSAGRRPATMSTKLRTTDTDSLREAMTPDEERTATASVASSSRRSASTGSRHSRSRSQRGLDGSPSKSPSKSIPKRMLGVFKKGYKKAKKAVKGGKGGKGAKGDKGADPVKLERRRSSLPSEALSGSRASAGPIVVDEEDPGQLSDPGPVRRREEEKEEEKAVVEKAEKVAEKAEEVVEKEEKKEEVVEEEKKEVKPAEQEYDDDTDEEIDEELVPELPETIASKRIRIPIGAQALTEEQAVAVVTLLTSGLFVVKREGRKRVHMRFMWVNKTLTSLNWCTPMQHFKVDPRRQIAITNIKGIAHGSLPTSLVIKADRDIDIEVPSTPERNELIAAFMYLLDDRLTPGSIKHRGSTPPPARKAPKPSGSGQRKDSNVSAASAAEPPRSVSPAPHKPDPPRRDSKPPAPAERKDSSVSAASAAEPPRSVSPAPRKPDPPRRDSKPEPPPSASPVQSKPPPLPGFMTGAAPSAESEPSPPVRKNSKPPLPGFMAGDSAPGETPPSPTGVRRDSKPPVPNFAVSPTDRRMSDASSTTSPRKGPAAYGGVSPLDPRASMAVAAMPRVPDEEEEEPRPVSPQRKTSAPFRGVSPLDPRASMAAVSLVRRDSQPARSDSVSSAASSAAAVPQQPPVATSSGERKDSNPPPLPGFMRKDAN